MKAHEKDVAMATPNAALVLLIVFVLAVIEAAALAWWKLTRRGVK